MEIQAITIKTNNQDQDIVNVYNKNNTLNKQEFKHYIQQINQNFILVGDFNGHHPIWEPLKNPNPNNCGTKLAEILTENDNFCLATPPNLPTYTNGHTGETSTIDLVFCSKNNLPQTNVILLADFGGDHSPILTTTEIKPVQQNFGKRPKWKFEQGAGGLDRDC